MVSGFVVVGGGSGCRRRREQSTISCFLVVMIVSVLLVTSFPDCEGLSTNPTRIRKSQDSNNARRDFFRWGTSVVAGVVVATTSNPAPAIAASSDMNMMIDKNKQSYFQRFPTLFAPLYGTDSRRTIRRQVSENVWMLEQNLELGPLETPLRCVVIRLQETGELWVHAPLAPTQEFFELVESCCDESSGSSSSSSSSSSRVAHVVVPTYALEHKVFVKDALERWPHAKLWTAPGQFSFPIRSVTDEFVWGKAVDGILLGSDSDHSDGSSSSPSWADEIQYETLPVGTFSIGGVSQTFYETAFFHKDSKSLIVTDSVAQVSLTPPPLNDPNKLLLVSKRSTADPFPREDDDIEEARQIGWEKTALLVSYFFPEHEELDPDAGLGVVTWTDGWHDNFNALAGRLIVPPVVRTLLYAQDPPRVKAWVERVASRWDFVQIIPAHFEAPISASPKEFRRAFAFLDDPSVDPFPANDLARGLQPIADFVYNQKNIALPKR